LVVLVAPSVCAQVHMDHEQQMEIPTFTLADSVRRQLEAPYLDDDEKRELRIDHGVWEPDDLDSPMHRAEAALIAGVWGDGSLYDDSVDPLDRAEAAIERGEPETALELLGKIDTVRAARLRGDALIALGRFEEADAAVTPVIEGMQAARIDDADELVEAVRALLVRVRVRGATAPAADYHDMMRLIARARDELDRMSWRARLLEGELLYAKDNRKEAVEALRETLSLNPRSAKAWALLGEIQVKGFSIDAAEGIAEGVRVTAETFGADAIAPDTMLAAARGRLRINDPDGAEELIAPVLARFPDHREGRALQAALAARRFEYEYADDLIARFGKLAPGVSDAALEVGLTLSDARQYAEASRYLNLAASLEPHRPEPVIALGLLELQWGRDREALDALETAAALDPFNTRVTNSLKLVRELRTYETIEGEHFAVRFRPGVDHVLAEEMLAPLERMHDRVTGTGPGGIDYEPAEKTLIELMPDHAWFSVRITGMPKLFTIAASTGRVIAMEAPRDGPGHKAGPYNWLRVVRHEYTHTVTLARTRNRIPHWMTEAAAVYLEDSPRDYDRARLLATQLADDGLFEMDQINLGFIRPRRPFDRPLAYAQGEWMYEYIIDRWGEKAPLDLMDLYAEGELQNEAFTKVLGESPDQFRAEFIEWGKGQVVGWGLALPEGVPTLETLELREAVRRARASADKHTPIGRLGEGLPGLGQAEEIEPVRPDVALLETWLAEYPAHPEILNALVLLKTDGGRGRATPELIPLLEAYAKARPVDPLPHRLLAQLYLSGKTESVVGGKDRAIPHLEYLDAREVHSASYAIELARRYADLGDWAHATEKAERAARIAPYDADVRELAARVAIRAGDLKTAERHIAALTELEPDREIHKRRLEAVRKMMDG